MRRAPRRRSDPFEARRPGGHDGDELHVPVRRRLRRNCRNCCRAPSLTFELGLLTFWGGALIGLLVGALKTFGGPILRAARRNAYVIFFTNTPALIQIYFLYFGLPEFGILWDKFICVLIGLTLNAGAYLTEIMRAGFISVRRTEIEAAETLGFSAWQQIRYVIVPHIAKTIYPALANFFIVILVMGTSIGAVIGVDELTGTGDQHLDRELPLARDVHRRRRHLCRADARRQPVARAGRPLGLPRQGEGVLMLERLIGEIPRFFSRSNIVLLLQAMGTTLALTVIGCVLGFLLAFVIVFLRQTPGRLGLPMRLVAILYVEIFRRIPFLVVTYLVLFFIQAFVTNASLFAIARDRHLHLFDGLYRRHHPRRLRIGAAPADRGGDGHEFQPLADADPA